MEDLIDLEFLLHRGSGRPGSRFFETEVEPWIEPDRIGRPDSATMSRALWQWLGERRRVLGEKELPGRAFSGAVAWVTVLLVAMLGLAGGGLVFGLLNQYDGRTFHVLVLLGLTLGIQWIILILSLLAFLTVGWWRHGASLTAAQSLLHGWITRLTRRALGDEAAAWWRETSRSASLFRLPALRVSQLAALSFNLGTTAALLACVFFLATRFGWETTTADTMGPALERGTRLLAFPWIWFRPDWVPSAEVIRQTLITWEDRKPVLPPAEASTRWYPFLIASLVTWGILPRLLLLAATAAFAKRALARYSFQERRHREWWRELTATGGLHVETEGPADGAFALFHGGMEPPSDLRRACLQQLRLNVEEQAVHGAGELEDDLAAFERAASFLSRRDSNRLVIVAEGWALAPREFRDFHERLRAKAGTKPEIDLLLVGLPGPERAATPPEAADVTQWERFIAELGDERLHVRPFRPSLAS